MKSLELRPGETLELRVHGDPRYGATVPVVYEIFTPQWGQDDGWDSNIIIECQSDGLACLGGSVPTDMDFGESRDDGYFYDEEGNIVGLTAPFIRLAIAHP